uniref:Uncharacterized protein n=1 Tax=Xiphophorus maculatus TaxID=8083 RepID=A0A3B5QUZ8_XIPMA
VSELLLLLYFRAAGSEGGATNRQMSSDQLKEFCSATFSEFLSVSFFPLSETFSSETVSSETFSSETVSSETFSSETVSSETFSSETFSSETVSSEMVSSETFSFETFSFGMFSSETVSSETFSSETFSSETVSSEMVSSETFSFETFSFGMFSSETVSSEMVSSETFSFETFSFGMFSSETVSFGMAKCCVLARLEYLLIMQRKCLEDSQAAWKTPELWTGSRLSFHLKSAECIYFHPSGSASPLACCRIVKYCRLFENKLPVNDSL